MIAAKKLVDELTPREVDMLLAALGAQQRYAKNGLDKAKEDDAVNRWATFCVELKTIRDKIERAVISA